MDVPVIKIDSLEVQRSYDAFAALQKARRENPSLADNPYFVALFDTAYARFLLNFEVME